MTLQYRGLKEKDFPSGPGFNLDKTYGRRLFDSEDCKILQLVVQRGGGCPISGNIQGQVGYGSKQPDLVEDVPADCRREFELDEL